MPLQLGRAFANASILVLGLASALLVWPALAQKPDAPAAPRMPSGFVGGADALLAKHYPQDAPGAVAIVVKDGRPVFRRAYGIADLEFGVLLESDMVFRIGSVTKQFTAAAILQLADQGKLALDDEVTKHVDGYDTARAPRDARTPAHAHVRRAKLHGPAGVVPPRARGADAAPDRRDVRAETARVRAGIPIQVQQLGLSPARPRHRESVRTSVRRLHPSDGAAAWHAPDDVRRSRCGSSRGGHVATGARATNGRTRRSSR